MVPRRNARGADEATPGPHENRAAHRHLLLAIALLGGACSGAAPGTRDASDGETRDGHAETASDAASDVAEDASPVAEVEAPAFEITRYALNLKLETRELDAELSLVLAAPGGNCVTLESALDVVGQPTWDGAASRAQYDGARLRICSDRAPQVGSVRIATRVVLREGRDADAPQVGFIRQDDRDGQPTTRLVAWLGGCRLFGPCETAVARQAELELAVTHAAGQTVLCAGTREATPTLTRCRVDGGARAPLYSALMLVAHPAYRRNDWLEAPAGRIALFEPASGRVAAALDPSTTRGALAFMVDLLGPLPYGPELRVGVVPLGWSGFEPPANILLDELLPDAPPNAYARPVQHALLHELAHQWAGDRVTLATTRDIVWKEAIAEYLAYLAEEQHGSPGEAEATRRAWFQGARFAPLFPLALKDDAPLSVLAANAVVSGPMTLFVQLEPYLGRAALLAAVKTFLAEPGARATNELRTALETAGGVSLTSYWNAWVAGTGEPPRPWLALQVDATTVTVTQAQAEAPLPFEIQVALRGATRSVRVPVRFDLQAPRRSASVPNPLGEPVVSATLDPDARTLWWPSAP